MQSKFNFLVEQEYDEPLTDSHAVRIHFLYSGENAREFLFENYKDALNILEEDTSSIIEEMENGHLRHTDKVGKYTEEGKYEFMETYGEIVEETELEDGKNYIIADIHFNILENYNIDFFSIEKFIKNLIDSLTKKTEFVRVFRDDRQLVNYKMIYEQIYKLEMELRETISEMFLKKYYPEIDNFVKDLKIDDAKLAKKFGKNKNGKDIKIQDLKEKNENVFFYLLFYEYSQLLNLKDLNNQELNRILENSKTFNKRKENIFSRGITDENDKFFLESIKNDLENIETVRNAIMHCRNLTEDELQKYSISRKNILKQYSFRKYGEDDIGLIVGDYYEPKTDIGEFKTGKKYKLKYRDGYDAIFITDEGNEVRFSDKEVQEYFIV